MNLSYPPGKDSTHVGNFLSRENLNPERNTTLKVGASRKTNSFLIAITIILIILLFVFLVYLGWLWYVRETGESASDFYNWIP